MKPVLEHLPPPGAESFFVAAFDLPYFGTPWHYHPEYELVLIVESAGKRFVGNSISEFSAGDLSFFGSNLPHLYRNPAPYYEKDPSLRARSIVVHFLETSLGKDFFELPQATKLNQFFERSRQGIDILGKTKKQVIKKMYNLLKTTGLQKLIYLLEILNLLADSEEYKLISGPGITGINVFDAERLDKAFQFILQNFQQKISLEDLSGLVYMTRTSFCRFFLERTKRTFSDYLTEVRLNHAARLLIEENIKITKVAYDSGYNNLSNFNRQFRKKYKMSPKSYRQAYQSESPPASQFYQNYLHPDIGKHSTSIR